MAGRKPALPPSVVCDAVLKFKNEIISTNDKGQKVILPATNNVWKDIMSFLGGSMTSSAIHTFVFKGRNDIKTKLGFCDSQKQLTDSDYSNSIISDTTGDLDDYYSSDENLPKKKFVITFSGEEWLRIKPQNVYYKLNDKKRPSQSCKNYYILPKNQWSPILAEHFLAHTQLSCCLSFKKSNVHPHGSNFVTVVGRCTTCNSCFNGIIVEPPLDNDRVLMHCTYIGNFNIPHDAKKRRLIGPAKDKVIAATIDKNISSALYREKEATRLMQTGKFEPAIIPSGGALRQIKWRQSSENKRHNDVLNSLAIMKNENEYKDIIHDFGCDPFFLHYHSSDQIHLYRNYCQNTSNPKIIIDATGSIVKKFKKFGMIKTKSIYLYEALVYNDAKQHSFTISNMISEQHTTIAIFNWLAKWLNNNVPSPREVVCDQSMALLSAIVQCFTQYSSLQQYLIVCSELTLGKLPHDSHWVPRCFVRTDVAHFVKLVSKWVPLKSISRRVREIILRSIGVIIKNQSLKEIYSVIFSLFVVLTNETDGVDIITGKDTPCEQHKQDLVQITSTGFVDFEQQYNRIMSNIELEDVSRNSIEEEYESQYGGLVNEKNPFQCWAEDIFTKSQDYIHEGNGINAMYLPSLVPLLIKCINLLPLWSGLMIPIFKRGNIISSSASVESSFKKLKTTTFKDIVLPTNIELFLERHVISLRGSTLLRSASKNFSNDIKESVPHLDNIHDLTITNNKTQNNDVTIPEVDTAYKLISEDDAIAVNENNIIDILESINSTGQPTSPYKRENIAKEAWDRKSKKQRNKNSYLNPNPHLRHISLNNLCNFKSLPNLKNGSKVTDLKSRNITGFGKIALNNTCAFDSIASMFMVSYCDSNLYSKNVNSMIQINDFLSFISSIVQNGIKPSTYKERTQIILRYLEPEIKKIEYNLTLADCHTTAAAVIQKLCVNIPTAHDHIVCTKTQCKNYSAIPTPVPYITFHTANDNLNGLQQFLSERFGSDYLNCGQINSYELSPCDGKKTINTIASTMHLIIDVLKWTGEMSNCNQSTEAASHVQISLKDIPQVLTHDNKIYELRGVCHYQKGLSKLRTSIGHYTAYCKRGPSQWELYDDTNINSKIIKESTVVECELLVYTI